MLKSIKMLKIGYEDKKSQEIGTYDTRSQKNTTQSFYIMTSSVTMIFQEIPCSLFL